MSWKILLGSVEINFHDITSPLKIIVVLNYASFQGANYVPGSTLEQEHFLH